MSKVLSVADLEAGALSDGDSVVFETEYGQFEAVVREVVHHVDVGMEGTEIVVGDEVDAVFAYVFEYTAVPSLSDGELDDLGLTQDEVSTVGGEVTIRCRDHEADDFDIVRE